ncbi:MAG: glycosyltransferase [Hyphomicrobiales bacterium]|nr:glycosyltransferase [Hyphomicrobiales bacterium]MBV8826267.1 glycosyltransferase [Hyphomicrobiales bacterium]MBV9429706.1 glycosyltransferase [Bradyrhizobiaceae bacterium]
MTGVEPSSVDVVIPVRDGARYLPDCLDSVMAQTRPAHIAVVVDDGSTDATPDILADYQRRWPALEVVRTEKRGLPHARNTGIARCRAPFIAFLDSDDVWAANKLERQLPVFAAGIGFVYCGYRLINQDGRPGSRNVIAPTLRGHVLAALLTGGNLISGSGSSVVVRAPLLERAGGFDESLSFAEDWDLWLRLSELSEVDFVPEPLVAIRLHEESMQHRNARHKLKLQMLQRLRVLDRWYLQDRLPPAVRAQIRRDLVSVAINEIRQEPLGGWFHAWQLVAELKECESSFARSLFSDRADFFREFPPRIASAVRRGIGWSHS